MNFEKLYKTVKTAEQIRKRKTTDNRVDGPADFSTGSASHTTVRTGHVYGGSPMDGDTSKYISKKDT